MSTLAKAKRICAEIERAREALCFESLEKDARKQIANLERQFDKIRLTRDEWDKFEEWYYAGNEGCDPYKLLPAY